MPGRCLFLLCLALLPQFLYLHAPPQGACRDILEVLQEAPVPVRKTRGSWFHQNGELYAAPMHPTSTAEETGLRFSVRRDQIELANASQGSFPTAIEPNAVCGTVQAIEYQGSYVKVTIHRSRHEDVIAHASDRGFFSLQVHLGDRVVARWSVGDIYILHAVGGRSYDQALTASLSRT